MSSDLGTGNNSLCFLNAYLITRPIRSFTHPRLSTIRCIERGSRGRTSPDTTNVGHRELDRQGFPGSFKRMSKVSYRDKPGLSAKCSGW